MNDNSSSNNSAGSDSVVSPIITNSSSNNDNAQQNSSTQTRETGTTNASINDQDDSIDEVSNSQAFTHQPINTNTQEVLLVDHNENQIIPPHTPKKYGGTKVIATIFGILIILVSVFGGVYLARRPSFKIGQAWDCSLYVFNVSRDGLVTVSNNSSRNEPSQKADVYINNIKVTSFDVPSLASGKSATLGNVSVDANEGFIWKVIGTVDCSNENSYSPILTPTIISTPTPTSTSTFGPSPTLSPTPPDISVKCESINAYDKLWNSLLISDLSKLNSGDKVRFAVSGTTSSGNFDKARFSVNSQNLGETTLKKPGSNEFYIEYTIPENVTSFTVKAEIHHSELGWF